LESVDGKISIANEFKRKLIHLSSSSIGFFYWFNTKELTLIILVIMFAITFTVDLLRYFSPSFNKFFLSLLRPILREHEADSKKIVFTGSTCLLFSCIFCIYFFPKEIAIMAILVLTICDTTAALIGKNYGKIAYNNKTLEGTITFFLTGAIILFVTPKIAGSTAEYFIAFIALLFASIAEFIPTKIDDNISVPIVFSVIYYILFKIFL
jgi:dolichol kinase